MRTLPLIAVAALSMWIAGDAYAQQNSETPAESSQTPQQVEGKKGAKGQRGSGRRGKRRGQGMEQGQGKKSRGRRDGAQMMEFMFKRFDKDQNGSISLAEAPDRMKQRFKQLDSNEDESVSKEEMKAAFEKRGQDKGGKRKEKDGAKKGKGGKKRQGRAMDPATMLKQMDKNNDGSISLEEAPERMKKRFDRMDTDSSGTITAEELKASFDKMKKQGGKKQFGRDKSANPDATKPIEPKRPPMADEGA